MDDPEMILNGALENHYKMINEFKERFFDFMPVFRIQIQDPDPDPEGQKLRTKIEKVKTFHVFNFLSAVCSPLRAEEFSFMEAWVKVNCNFLQKNS